MLLGSLVRMHVRFWAVAVVVQRLVHNDVLGFVTEVSLISGPGRVFDDFGQFAGGHSVLQCLGDGLRHLTLRVDVEVDGVGASLLF